MIASLLLLASVRQDVPYGPLLIRAKTLYTMAGPPIRNASIVVENGKIVRVSAEPLMVAGGRTVEAEVVTPGFIDARSTVGLTGINNDEGHDQDMLDRSGPVQPELRAIDAYNPREPLVGYLRSVGVTTVATGHAPGTLVSGTLCVVKLRGGTVEEATMVPEWGVVATLGSELGSRAKGLATLRAELSGAKEVKADDPSLRKRAFGRVLRKEIPLIITAHRAQDLASALRLQREFGFRLVLDGAAEAPRLLREIKASGAGVMLHPAMIRTEGDAEEASFETAAKLRAAGIPFAFTSGYEGYVPKVRVVPFEAAVFAANGLGTDEALRTLTIGAATLLGIERRVGTIEVGKDADLALFDGAPLEPTTRCVGSVIAGEYLAGGR